METRATKKRYSARSTYDEAAARAFERGSQFQAQVSAHPFLSIHRFTVKHPTLRLHARLALPRISRQSKTLPEFALARGFLDPLAR